MFSELASDLDALTGAGLRRRLRRVEQVSGSWAIVDGRRLLILGSNDYLGLARHPEVIAAAQDAAARWGGGSGGSRLTTGNLALHEELEAELAALKGADAALVFSSGYLAAMGTVPALVGRGDLILSDALNHACLIDGCRLSGAEIRVYRHADPEHAAELLQDRTIFRRCLVITDGVFSMDGDIAPLPQLAALCREHDAWLLVDDAHATGVLGASGGGTAEHFATMVSPIHPFPPGRGRGRGAGLIHMGTLSKALGSQGGFIAGPAVVIETLRNRARSFLFDTGLAPAAAGAALAALGIVRGEPERRERLRDRATLLRALLSAGGIEVGSTPDQRPGEEVVTPILPVIVGGSAEAVALAAALEERGVWAPAIRPPTVAAGTAQRLSVTADLEEADIRMAVEAITASWR